jgi:hypothetical protein
MRASMIVAVFLPVVLVAGEPNVTAPVSAEDVRQICKVVASTTTDPITSILGVISTEYVPGAVARESFHFAADGTKVPSTCYERADLVWVVTSHKTLLPTMHKLEKSPHGWKIISKQQMVD